MQTLCRCFPYLTVLDPHGHSAEDREFGGMHLALTTPLICQTGLRSDWPLHGKNFVRSAVQRPAGLMRFYRDLPFMQPTSIVCSAAIVLCHPPPQGWGRGVGKRAACVDSPSPSCALTSATAPSPAVVPQVQSESSLPCWVFLLATKFADRLSSLSPAPFRHCSEKTVPYLKPGNVHWTK